MDTAKRRAQTPLGDMLRWGLLVGSLTWPAMSVAQRAPAKDDRPAEDIVVTGQRLKGSVVTEVAPLAVLDENTIRSLGGTKIRDLLRAVRAQTASGPETEPILLLNGRRVASDDQIHSLPPEAIERMEILPEAVAVQFGYAPTKRVVNFITKRNFTARTMELVGGGSTDGGAGQGGGEIGSTMLRGDQRFTLSARYDRTNALRQDARRIVPDSDILFDRIGNVVASGGATLDPRLDALAGRPVAVAAVPAEPGRRSALDAYLAGAGQPRTTDLGAFRTLVPATDAVQVRGLVTQQLGRAMLTLDASFAANRSRALNGLAPAVVAIGRDHPANPFATTVNLYRYFEEAGVLRQQGTGTTVHTGGGLNGALGKWNWNVTAAYDRSTSVNRNDLGVDPAVVQAAVDAGANPFQPFAPAIARSGSATVTRSLSNAVQAKAFVNGPAARLPAGPVLMTVTLDQARTASDADLGFAGAPRARVTQVTRNGSVGVVVPIASAREGVLSALGELSANADIRVAQVTNAGTMLNTNYGMNWTPVRPLRLGLIWAETRTPPPVRQLTDPVLLVPNVPFFDFATGQSILVTTVNGGNPALRPEERRTMTVNVDVQPIRDGKLTVGVGYTDTAISNQLMMLGASTPAILAAFPRLFQRDANARLIEVDMRPVNLFRQRQQSVMGRFNMFGTIGPEPQMPDMAAGPPPGPPPQPKFYYMGLMPTLRLRDRLTLQEGAPPIDLLAGDTISGTGGQPRMEVFGFMGVNGGGWNLSLSGFWRGATRVRSDLPASDLRFSSLTNISFSLSAELERWLTSTPLARRTTLELQIDNLLNQRLDVRDGLGRTPDRFQPAFLDPLGRVAKLTLRKLF